tara:strand:- start:6212 stop:6475 length:264 start_codon:yes stop_codon:yes gene_type:complete
MPKYYYVCDSCEESFEIIHSISDKKTDCEACEKKDILRRVPYSFLSFNKKEAPKKAKVGSLVENFINESKEELKVEKEKNKNKEYKE